jgi:hypothetical protein
MKNGKRELTGRFRGAQAAIAAPHRFARADSRPERGKRAL